MHLPGIYKFIQFFGSQKAAAEAIGLKQQAISNWMMRGSIPYKQVLRIVFATKGHIRPEELAPREQEANDILNELIETFKHEKLKTTEIDKEPSNDLPHQHITNPTIDFMSEYRKELRQLYHYQERRSMVSNYFKGYPQFWIGKTGRAIKGQELEVRMLAFYLLTSPHVNKLGIYYLPTAYVVYDAEIEKQTVLDGLMQLNKIDFCTYDHACEYVWVHEIAHHQIANCLEERNKWIKSVNDIFQSLPDLSFLKKFYHRYREVFHLQPRKEFNP